MGNILRFSVLVALACAAPVPARGALIIQFNGPAYTGVTPSGSAPFLTATFEDGAGADAGKVLLTLQANLQGASEKIFDVVFNFSGTPSTLSATFISGTGPGFTNTDASGNNSITGNVTNGWGSAGGFDFGFNFPNSSGSKFDGSESVTIRLSSSAGSITASQFNDLNSSSVLAAFHVGGIGTGDESGKLAGTVYTPPAVPEPSTIVSASIAGLAGLATLGWRRRRSAIA